jgi:alpha-ketoglutarate-dependent taurine dioxygenase
MLAALSALLLSAVLAEERIHIQDLPGLGFGGVVEDFDVRTATPADGSVLQRELERRHVLVFRNQSLTPADEIAFLSAYGDAKNLIDFSGTTCTPSLYAQDAAKSPLMAPPEPQRSCSVDGYPTLRKIGTATSADGTPVAMKASIGYEWHADSEGHANTMFYCLQTPDFGSDTHFVSGSKYTIALHDRLAPLFYAVSSCFTVSVRNARSPFS